MSVHLTRSEMPFNVFIIFLILCGFFGFGFTRKSNGTGIAGSVHYTTTPIQMKACSQPTLPYDKQPTGVLKMELKNSIIKGNYTALKTDKSFKVSLQDFNFENGKWQLALYVKNLSCRIGFISAMLKAFGIRYNKKTCIVPKGVYPFEVDYKMIDRIWVGERRTGRILQRAEAYTVDGTLSCNELELNVAENKD